MERCATCRWWQNEYDFVAGSCELTYSTRTPKSEPPTLAVVVTDGTEPARLLTDQDFGCVQHQPQENPTP
jgi:hypothetical protein